MGRVENLRNKYLFEPFAQYLVKKSKEGDLSKAQDTGQVTTVGAKRYDVALADNNAGRPKAKAAVPFSVLRKFSTSYDVARACINTRKRQIAQLNWKVVPVDDDTNNDKTDLGTKIASDLKTIGGYNLSFRNLGDMIIEDLMVLDAVALEKRQTLGGDYLGLLPIDAATIKVRVDSAGRTPMPPEIAYQQFIRGTKTAEFTADELYYGMLNPRTNSPYGLAPLETLVLTVNSALQSALFNLQSLTEGNVPEGFYTVPKEWSATQIEQFQEVFDAAVAGNAMANTRIRFMPEGTYTPTKKLDDMRYKEFSEWLMKITCSVFDVQPIEIGFEPKQGLGGAGFSEGQDVITNRKAIIPLANFLKDIYDSVIQQEYGYTDMEFMFEGLEYKDPKMEAEVNEIKIRSGQATVDEIRQQDQKDPLGADKPFVTGNITYIDEDSRELRNQAAGALISMNSNNDDSKDEQTDTKKEAEPVDDSTKKYNAQDAHIQLVSEMRSFRKYALNSIKRGKKFRNFESEVLPEATVNEMNKRLAKAKDADTVKAVFSEYMQDYQINFLADVISLQHSLQKVV